MQHSVTSITCQVRLGAEVIDSQSQQARIKLHAMGDTACESCRKRGGCQSLSVYHWFFAENPLLITQPADKQYVEGQQLTLHFPQTLLKQSLVFLLGLPLFGFLSGIALVGFIGEVRGFLLSIVFACIGFYVAKKKIQQHLASKLHIKP